MASAQTALKYEVQVTSEGRIEIPVPFPAGERVTVFVMASSAERFDDLVSASESSLGFWDSPLDDEDWNNT